MKTYLAKFSSGGQVEFHTTSELPKQELKYALKSTAIEYGITGKIVSVDEIPKQKRSKKVR